MSTHTTHAATSEPRPCAAATERRLRMMDLSLGLVLSIPMALPMLGAALCARRHSVWHWGAAGRQFERQQFAFGDGRVGRLLEGLGATRWPDLWHVLRGDMAWVGPRPRSVAELPTADAPPVRPGLFNTWFVRSRTAVAFGSEQEADAEDLRQRDVKRHLGLLLRGMLAAWLPQPAAQAPDRIQVCDVLLNNVDMGGALAHLATLLDQPRSQQVCFVNPACVNIAAKHRAYRRTLGRAALVLPDGIGIKVAADLLGTPLKQNVNGTDLFPRLMALMAQRRGRVFLLGGQVGVADQVAAEIRAQWPEVCIAGVRDGFFTVAQEGEVAAEVRRSHADLLLVARGVPSQDLFIDRHLDAFGVKVAMGVGGLFDFVSGRIRRAPAWMRDVGLEWVYRLMQEPGRMWRRYLLGNVSFLVRVLLQRLRLRACARDLSPPHRSGASLPPDTAKCVRAVIFATPAASPDLPVAADFPAALLPMGHTSAIEYQISQLARAGIRQVDIVVCHRPERVRDLVDDGQRWGVNVVWHLAKDPERPYGVLGAAMFRKVHRLLVAHVDAWIPTDIVQRLAVEDRSVVTLDAGGHVHWCGFASGPPEQFATLDGDMQRADLAQLLSVSKPHLLPVHEDRCVPHLHAADLLRAQLLASAGPGAMDVPLSWVPSAWGAMSPHAAIHPSVKIEGPVFIGPGCVVEAGATLGPNVWLSRDVIVSEGTGLVHALVLPDTYIGKDLEFDHTVVSGTRVRHLTYGLETALPAADGLLLDLNPPLSVGGNWLGQLLACAATLVVLPLVALVLALRRLRGQGLPWVRRTVVVGRHEIRPGPRTELLHCPNIAGASPPSRFAFFGGLMDVALGRRAWFGVRARTTTQWYALRNEWQMLLCKAPIGLIHAQAWADDEALRDDAEAVADVFYAARQGVGQNLRLLWVLCGSLLRRRQRMAPTLSRPIWRASPQSGES